MHPLGVFSIPAVRNFVPEKLKPWIYVVFVIIIQLSSGIYLSAVSEMVGSLSLMQEDIMMAGYASMVGMGLTFTTMFRLKFRFTSKHTMLICCGVVIICNLICMRVSNVPVLVVTSFFAGIFRMWATFECMSTIQLWLTPKRDLSVFFCFIQLIVQSCIQLSGMLTVYTAFWAKWEYMHWLVVGILGLMMLAIMLLLKNHRSMPKLPLYGIDWLGALMWGLTVLSIIFVCVYGEHYDWYNSVYIQMGTAIGGILLVLNLWRASFIRHPYISLQTWRYKSVHIIFFLYIVVDLLLAPSHLFEHIYVESILGYDSLNVISLNWFELLGILFGATFTYIAFARYKWRYKTMTVLAFICITSYLLLFYFFIDYNVPKEALLLPIFMRSVGYVIIAICFITSLTRVPFHHFFQAISIQSFVCAGFGGVLGTAVLGRALNFVMKKNFMLLSTNLDSVNSVSQNIPKNVLYGILNQHVLLVSMKELYGWLALISLCCLFLFAIKQSSIYPKNVIHPRFNTIRLFVRNQLIERKLIKINSK